MKINNLFINFIILSCFLIGVNCKEEKYIEKTIYIEDGYPFIKLNISGQGEKKFYISLLFPTIVAFPNNGSQEYRFNSSINGTFNDKNISFTLPDPRSNILYDLEIGETTININNINTKFNISVTKNKTLDGQFAGIFGLNRGVYGNKFDTFIDQLYNKKLISNKIFYIGSFYENGKLKNESKLVIGKIPDEIKSNFDKFSNCSLVSSNNSYKCSISKFKFGKNKIALSKIINVNFIEGKKDKTILPLSLIEFFNKSINDLIINRHEEDEEDDNDLCNIDGNNIICPNNETKISFYINKKEFKLSNIWADNTISFDSHINNDTIIIGSELAHFDRIYDIGENRIYFENNKNDNYNYREEAKIWIVIIIISTLLLLICILIIIIISRINNKYLNKGINNVSFQDILCKEDEGKEINLVEQIN